MDDLDDGREVEILILGDAETGKSTFLNRLVLHAPSPARPLKDSDQPYILSLKTSKRGAYRLAFSDTAAPQSYLLHRPHLLVIAFDISRVSTLRSAKRHWRRLVDAQYNRSERLPVLLLGLKRDLRVDELPPADEGEDEAGERCVLPQEALRVAQEMRCDRYAECSARTGDCWDVCVQDVLGMAVRSLREDGGRTPGTQCLAM